MKANGAAPRPVTAGVVVGDSGGAGEKAIEFLPDATATRPKSM